MDIDYLDFDIDEPECDMDMIEYIRIVRHTEKATLFETTKGACWIPKSLYTLEADNVASFPEFFNVTYQKSGFAPLTDGWTGEDEEADAFVDPDEELPF